MDRFKNLFFKQEYNVDGSGLKCEQGTKIHKSITSNRSKLVTLLWITSLLTWNV